jgi:hypothetical protein
MDAGVVSGTLQPALVLGYDYSSLGRSHTSAGKVPSTLRVTAARVICGVSAPRRCSSIAVVALPCI